MTTTSEQSMVPWRDFAHSYSPSADSPFNYERIWINRKEWPAPELVVVRDMNPMMNVWGLMWKPGPPLPPAALTDQQEP